MKMYLFLTFVKFHMEHEHFTYPEAIKYLETFDHKADLLREVARFIVERKK